MCSPRSPLRRAFTTEESRGSLLRPRSSIGPSIGWVGKVGAVTVLAAAYPEQTQATTALVLGIIGIACCGLLGIAAWVMANNELQAISSGRRDPVNEGTAKAARVVGIVATTLIALPLLLLFLAVAGSITLPFFSP